MPSEAFSWSLGWDPAAASAVADSQKWVLTAMQKHGQPLVTMLWRILGNEADVCDAYQDTFLQLSHYADGKKPNNVKAFVFRTASNVAISLLRRRKVHIKAIRIVAGKAEFLHETDFADDFDSGRLRDALRTNIARLPDKLRSVVVLRDLAELSYPQVAKIVDVSVASVRVYRCRAIQLLSGWMTRQDGDNHG